MFLTWHDNCIISLASARLRAAGAVAGPSGSGHDIAVRAMQSLCHARRLAPMLKDRSLFSYVP